VVTCSQCFGTKQLDDRGYPWTGQPAFDISDCPRCRGTGEEPRSALYSFAVEREAEFALDKLEGIAR
jgi:hypothetical protein